MAAVIQFPMEDCRVNSEFKESESQESQKVSPSDGNRHRQRKPLSSPGVFNGYSASLDIQPLVPRSKLRGIYVLIMQDNGTRPNIGWYRATGAGGREEMVGEPKPDR